jgi:cysteine-rich repeat protein
MRIVQPFPLLLISLLILQPSCTLLFNPHPKELDGADIGDDSDILSETEDHGDFNDQGETNEDIIFEDIQEDQVDVEQDQDMPPTCGNGAIDEGEDCDDENAINGDGCDNDCTFSCTVATQAMDCNDDLPCTDDSCDAISHMCRHTASPASVVCRPAVDPCDAEELCDGVNPQCPDDSRLPTDSDCDDGQYCTNPDSCTIDGICTGPMVSSLYGVTTLSAGFHHTCALMSNGTGKCWGENDHGQLGDGTTVSSSAPVDVLGLGSDIVAIEAGGYHSCAITNAGAVMCWGENNDGQLGDGTTTPRSIAGYVSGISSGAIKIELGESHTCAITAASGVKCWGINSSGELGDGTFTSSTTPVDVEGLLSGILQIGTGYNHTCAVTETGGVKCWGYNNSGQLGDGTTNTSNTPVDVSGLATGAISVNGGRYHTCALMNSWSIKCWGLNNVGELGDGTTVDSYTPVDVIGLSADAHVLSVGSYHGCAITEADGIKCWGYNDAGQLGDGTTTNSHTPVSVIGLTTDAVQISALGYYTCAAMALGGAECWGRNGFGQPGDGTTSGQTSPVDVVCQ